MESAPKRPDRTLLVVIGVVVVIVVVALVVVFTRGGSAPLDESTPAGVVQRYAQAVIDGDEDAAQEYLTAVLRDDCRRYDAGPQDDVRVTLSDTRESDAGAEVEVTIVTSTGGGLFGPSEYREDASFYLVREGGGWAIESTPWQFTICEEAAQ